MNEITDIKKYLLEKRFFLEKMIGLQKKYLEKIKDVPPEEIQDDLQYLKSLNNELKIIELIFTFFKNKNDDALPNHSA